jgi:hypothetical protein
MEQHPESHGEPEALKQPFDFIVDRIKPFADQRLLYKLSAYTRGQDHDALGCEYVTPVLQISFEGHTYDISISILQEEIVNFTSDSKNVIDVTRKVYIRWSPKSLGTESGVVNDETYSSDTLDNEAQKRLDEITRLYAEAAWQLAPEEARSRGFNEEFIASLQPTQPRP